MDVTVGTFNLNNLFSRYNFEGEIEAVREGDTTVDGEDKYEFGPGSVYRIRTYMGRLVKAKKEENTERIADRIKRIDVDVLAVQEAEDIDTLKQFNRDRLGNAYKHAVLVDGNDPRLIDVGILSKLPIGGITSWQHATHRSDPSQPVFGRDLLQVEIQNPARSKRLFTIFNNHLKSHYVSYTQDPIAGQMSNSQRRKRQAEILAKIAKKQTRPNSAFIILGDMNDPPDSPYLKPFVGDNELSLHNALEDPEETRPAKADTSPPPSKAWTHRFKKSGEPAKYELYDQIWLSPALTDDLTGAWIDRRERHGGDGSDHDPAWVELHL